jgi:hypothetical protein
MRHELVFFAHLLSRNRDGALQRFACTVKLALTSRKLSSVF